MQLYYVESPIPRCANARPSAGPWLRALRCVPVLAAVLLAILPNTPAPAAVVPPPDKLLPADTVAFATAPDFKRLKIAWNALAYAQLLNDPSMKPFVDRFMSRWNEKFAAPVERALDLNMADCKQLLNGQVTAAIIPGTKPGQRAASTAFVLLIDAADKSDLLEKQLLSLRKKWQDAGKALRTEKLQGGEFLVLSLSESHVPPAIRELFPHEPRGPAEGQAKLSEEAPLQRELLVGRVDSLLVTASSREGLEKVLARLRGGAVPALADLPAYQADHRALFREASCFGWVNAQILWSALAHTRPAATENSELSNPPEIPRHKLLEALGVSGVDTLAFSFQAITGGGLLQMRVGVPETNRQGLVSIVAGEPKDLSLPAFVPADALQFQRWRIDGKKAWNTVEKMLHELSPQFSSAVNFVLDSANIYANQKQPGFDIRRNLLGNLGDDIIRYQRPARAATPGAQPTSASVLLIGSPNPQELAASLGSIFVFLSQQASTPPQERDLLGRKVFSLPLGAAAASLGLGSGSDVPPTLHYAATSGYVGLSTNLETLEEYLRGPENQTNALRDIPGLLASWQKVGGPALSLFGYENESATMRARFDAWKTDSAGTNSNPARVAALLPGVTSMAASAAGLKDWLDPSLLPPYEKVAKYFSFTVYGAGPTADGLTLKILAPIPPASKP